MIYHVEISVLTCITNFVLALTLEPVKLGIILPSNLKYPFAISRVKPGIEIAIEVVKASQILPKHDIQLYLGDSDCSGTIGTSRATELHVRKKVNVFMGPCCDYAVAPVGRFVYYWSTPLITAGAPVTDFDDKSIYKTLTRIHYTYGKNVQFLWEVTQRFNWSTIALLSSTFENSEKTKSNCYFTLNPIFQEFKNRGYEPKHKTFDEKYTSSANYELLLLELSKHARVIVLCGSADSVRDILIKAHELGFDNGEYVFLNIDLTSSIGDIERPWYRPQEDERNRMAQRGYEALMTVSLRKPASREYNSFSMEVKKRAKQTNIQSPFGEGEVNCFVGAFHDAVIIYALALNETLSANKSITDADEITKRMWNKTFDGITGDVSIDANGDRDTDFSLWDMNPKTLNFEVVANYFGKDKEYKPVAGKTIHWAGDRKSPPPDTPKCGFDGSKCLNNNTTSELGVETSVSTDAPRSGLNEFKCLTEKPFPEYSILIIVLMSLVLIGLVAVLVIIYRWKRR